MSAGIFLRVYYAQVCICAFLFTVLLLYSFVFCVLSPGVSVLVCFVPDIMQLSRWSSPCNAPRLETTYLQAHAS